MWRKIKIKWFDWVWKAVRIGEIFFYESFSGIVKLTRRLTMAVGNEYIEKKN